MLRYLLLPLLLTTSHNISQELCVVDSQHERLCIQWACDPNDGTLEACAAVYITWTCSLLSSDDALIRQCCTEDKRCLSMLYQQSLETLKLGKRIDDPLRELAKRRQRQDKLSQSLDDLLSSVVSEKVLVVQVGAHVGALRNDPIYPYLVSSPDMIGLLFEPMPVQFDGLSYNYRHALREQRVVVVNAAVCEKKGTVEFYHKRPPLEDSAYRGANEAGAHTSPFDPLFHYLYRDETSQMGTLGTSHGISAHIAKVEEIGKRGNIGTEKEDDYVASLVECTTLRPHMDDMLEQHPSSPLVLIVDAEGADVAVLRDMLSIKLPDIVL